MHAPTLTTAHLRLVPAGVLDIDTFHAMLNNADIRRYLCDDRVLPREDVESMVWSSLRSFATDGMGLWLLYEHYAPDAIGFCMLRPPGEHAMPELLYAVLPGAWGRGYAVEAARATIEHAFGTLRCTEILAEMDEPNQASKRVAEKLGMKPIGTRLGQAHTLLQYVIRTNG